MSKKIALLDAVPDIMDYWDYEKNKDIDPADLSASSSVKVWTRCPICGTSVLRNVRFSWEKDDDGVGHLIHCRTCGKRSDDNSLVKMLPAITQYWDYEKNEHDPEYYTVSSGKKAYIKCPTCGKSVYRAICDSYHTNVNGETNVSSCIDCLRSGNVNRTYRASQNMLEACPDIEKYWMYDKNPMRPEEISRTSLEKIYLRCPVCGDTIYRRCVNSLQKKGDSWSVIQCHKCGIKQSVKSKTADATIASVYPEIESWWDYSGNNTSPTELGYGSKYNASLVCPSCHSAFNRPVRDFITQHSDGSYKPVGCPVCGFTPKEIPVDNLLAVCPEIENWWNYSKNYPHVPEEYTKGSGDFMYLTCPDCGMELYTGIHSLVESCEDGTVKIRHKGKCRKYKALASDNNLVTNYPQVQQWWDYDKNADLPEEYTLYSPHKAHFKCPDCGAESYLRISDAFNLLNGEPCLFQCSYCADIKVLPGFNDLQTTDPELAKEWSPNNDREPTSVRKSNGFAAKWICPTCHGEYTAYISEREVGDDSCPICRGTKILPGYNDLLTTDPELAKEWSPNNDSPATNVRKVSFVSAKWICPTCHGEYNYPIAKRTLGDDVCPICHNNQTLTGFNDLATTDPDLAKEWSPNNERTPTEVRKNNVITAKWICPTCHGEYGALISEREVGDDSCPVCRGSRVLAGFNDLATTDPDLAKEWSPNNERKSTEVRKNNVITAKWICPTCHGEYGALISEREVGDNSCPFCNNKKVLPDYNSLHTVHPELMDEWQAAENALIGRDPNQLLPSSTDKTWWKCPECGYKYLMSPKVRVLKNKRGHTACPRCNGLRWKQIHYI